MCKYICLFLFLSSSIIYSQNTFQKTYGGEQEEEGFAVVETPDGGFIIAGSTRSYGAGNYDFYIIRTEPDGDTVWTRTFGGTGYDKADDIVKMDDTHYLIGGYTTSYGAGDGDIYLIKINIDGDTSWTKTIGTVNNDHLNKMKKTSDGGFILCGDFEDYGQYQYYLVKTNSSGDTLWTKSYEYGTANSVDQTNDGGYILIVWPYETTQSRYDFQLVKTDAEGGITWSKFFGGPDVEVGYAVQQTTDGGYIMAGRTDSYGNGASDFYLLKTNSIGDSLWARTYGGDSNERAFTAIQTADDGYLIGGYTSSFNVDYFDFYLVRTDSNGDTLWTRNYGGLWQEELYDVEETADEGFAAVGYTYSFGAGSYPNIYLVKTNSYGLLTGLQEPAGSGTMDFYLAQNYPNPFNPATRIKYQVPERCFVSLRVYDVLGKESDILVNEEKPAGIYEVTWDAASGSCRMPSGVYFYQLSAGKFIETKKMILLR
ncbi:MAG TPA: T9SS type A sorting domain-containing protein [Ignavibacteriaceae bacterium]